MEMTVMTAYWNSTLLLIREWWYETKEVAWV